MFEEIYRPERPPFAHQEEALRAGWDREGFAYLLEMGLGKSRVVADNFCMLYERDLVDALVIVAPKDVYTNWTTEGGELDKWLWGSAAEAHIRHAYRAGRQKRELQAREDLLQIKSPGARILAINIEALSSTQDAPEYLRRFLRTHRSLVAVDESTVLKNPKSVRTKTMLKLAPLASYRRILTGSPSTGSPSDLFAQFEFLGPGECLLGHRTFTGFQAHFCKMREIPVQGRNIKIEVGARNIEELADLVAQHSFRRLKRDCLDLPPKVYMRREIEMTEDQARAYDELKKSAMTIVSGEDVTTDIVITQMMRMHQVLCGHIKTDEGNVLPIKNNRLAGLLHILDESPSEQAVIWCGYRPDAHLVAHELMKKYGEDSVAEWHGGKLLSEREAGEADFQAGRRRFMVSTSAGARGRTWTAGTLAVYYSNQHSLEIRQQSEDRTHRIGTVGTVTYVDLVIPDTLDDKIISALRNSRDVAASIVRDGLQAWI